jgi:hypothetical protein
VTDGSLTASSEEHLGSRGLSLTEIDCAILQAFSIRETFFRLKSWFSSKKLESIASGLFGALRVFFKRHLFHYLGFAEIDMARAERLAVVFGYCDLFGLWKGSTFQNPISVQSNTVQKASGSG